MPILPRLLHKEKIAHQLDFVLAFTDSLPDMLLVVDCDGTIIYVNHVPSSLSIDHVIGSNVLDYAPADAREELRLSLAEIFAGAPARMRLQRGILGGGTERWFSLHTGPVNMGSDIAAVAIVARDVTEQQEADLRLAESEARYRVLVENAPEAIVVLDVDQNRFVDANRQACALFHVEMADLLQKDPVGLSPEMQRNGMRSGVEARRFIGQALNGMTPQFEWTHVKSTGEQIDCDVRLARLPSREKRLVRGSVTDITERRRTDLQLREWQKLDALGKLAGGIAHDFNNVLAVISSAAQLVEMESTEPQSRADAATILTEAKRGMCLTSQLLTFAHRHVPPYEIIDINDVIRDIAKTMRRVLDSRISLEEDLAPVPLHVAVSRSHLDQLVMNLILNARDAIEGAGRIAIRTEDQSYHAWLYVTDNGCGMTEEVRSHASEPFFTTKELSGGTGLGLSMVNDIVTEAHGTMEITSIPGKGTTMAIGFWKVDYAKSA
jgi:PAS domain S-box-containing protein